MTGLVDTSRGLALAAGAARDAGVRPDVRHSVARGDSMTGRVDTSCGLALSLPALATTLAYAPMFAIPLLEEIP